MSRSTFTPILKQLQPLLPGFASKGRMLFKVPIDQMLLGIHLEPCAYSKNPIEAVVFAMPLCVPIENVHFGFSEWLTNDGLCRGVWTRDQFDLIESLHHAIDRQALPFLEARATLEAFISSTPLADRLHTLRNISFAYARLGQRQQALEVLERLLAKDIDRTVAWQVELSNKARLFRDELLRSPESAGRQLEIWERFTVESLKLTPFWTHSKDTKAVPVRA